MIIFINKCSINADNILTLLLEIHNLRGSVVVLCVPKLKSDAA